MLRDSCDIGFPVQFNVEFPRQVMNFPIKLTLSLPRGSPLMSKSSGVRQSKIYKCHLALMGGKGVTDVNLSII